MDEKRFRIDLFIALFALVISSVAAGASAYQTYVIRQQFSATVWPFLTFVTSTQADAFAELDLNNAGIGPALIRSAVVTRDGKTVNAPPDRRVTALEVAIEPDVTGAGIDEKRSGVHGKESMTMSSILRGDVIPAGGSVRLLRVDGKFFARRIVADARHVDITICYCSLLGTCWLKRLWDPSVEPHTVSSCPTSD
jgi:hypothetical protein